MASRYWVGGTGNWSDATNHWASVSGGTPNAANLPTASDTVNFDQATTNCTLDGNVTVLGCIFLSGTLNLSTYTLNCQTIDFGGSTARTLAFGTGNITIIGNNILPISYLNPTNLTITGTPVININSTATTGTVVKLYLYNTSEANSISLNILSGTYTLYMLGNTIPRVLNINFTGFSGVWDTSYNVHYIYGNMTLSSTMTTTSSSAISMRPSSGTKTITTNGCILNCSLTFTATATATIQVQGNITVVSSKTTQIDTTFTTVDLNGKTINTGLFSITDGTITLNGGTIVCTGSFSASGSGTVSAGTGTGKISMTSASAKSFSGGSKTYPCTLSNDGAGALTISGSNTFTTITNTVTPATFTFALATTTTVTNFNVAGTAGNLVTINSSISGSKATLSSSTPYIQGAYLSIKDSTASGTAAWYAGITSVNAGNNSGWVFAAPQKLFLVF